MFDPEPVITFVVLLVAALLGGMIAHRLRQPVILGYLIIGTIIGPNALGLVEDETLITTAATMGVSLLMFTLGLEISFDQLRDVGKIGIWGGILQIAFTLALGLCAGVFVFNWPFLQSLIFGLIISLSSTSVCLKILMERGELSSLHGRIMIAFLILQDLSVVIMMVALPAMGGATSDFLQEILFSLLKAVTFVGAALLLGQLILPWVLGNVGGMRSRELFLLTVLALCLGATIGTHYFGLSMVFGAFLVGLILRSTTFNYQALAEITPLRDIFAALFFVSMGMLLDPVFLLNNWLAVLMLVGIVLLIKVIVVFSLGRMFGYGNRVSLLTGVGLFQLGEFGFILSQGALNLNIIPEYFYSLILSVTVITMLLTPLAISLISRLFTSNKYRIASKSEPYSAVPSISAPQPIGSQRIVIAGYGRVGYKLAEYLEKADIPYLVIDIDPERISEARKSHIPRIYGDATNEFVLAQSDLLNAAAFIITFPDPTAVLAIARIALNINPRLNVMARYHRSRDADRLKTLGIKELVNPEAETSYKFLKGILKISGKDKEDRESILDMLRSQEARDASDAGNG